MSGFQEILLVAIILLGILFVPRMMSGRIEEGRKQPLPALSRKVRLAIVASILYPAIVAAFIQPWHRDVTVFMYAGLGPVVLGWLGYWAFTGRKR
jgi:predicted Na+-dependent transporter